MVLRTGHPKDRSLNCCTGGFFFFFLTSSPLFVVIVASFCVTSVGGYVSRLCPSAAGVGHVSSDLSGARDSSQREKGFLFWVEV